MSVVAITAIMAISTISVPYCTIL